MDDVDTDTAGLHAAAWQALFDQVLPLLAGAREVEPFDVEADHHAHSTDVAAKMASPPSWPPAAWSPNNYQLCKQADALMLFYLLSAEELRNVLDRLEYPLSPTPYGQPLDFYMARTSHDPTLSRVVHAWVNARADRHRAWTLFTEALQADLADIQAARPGKGPPWHDGGHRRPRPALLRRL